MLGKIMMVTVINIMTGTNFIFLQIIKAMPYVLCHSEN